MVHCTSVEENSSPNLYKSPDMVSIELCRIALNKGKEISLPDEGARDINGKFYLRFLSSLTEDQRDQLYPSKEQSRREHDEILKKFYSNVVPFFNTTVLTSHPREGLDLFIESLSIIENMLVTCPTHFLGGSDPLFLDFGIFPIVDKIGKWTEELPDFELPRLMTWRRFMRAHPYVIAATSSETASDKRSYFLQLMENY